MPGTATATTSLPAGAFSREEVETLTRFVEEIAPTKTAQRQMNQALPALYDELREMAAGYLRRERRDHTLQPTALVHESFLRLQNQHSVDWGNRLQFLSIAARMMRRILANHASGRSADKRGAGAPKVE